MNTLSLSGRSRSAGRTGFTLVELLVVISIIAILVALTIPVVMAARRTAQNGAISSDISQLDMAIKSYKDKFGEYPPDFAGLITPQSSNTDPISGTQYGVEAQNLILRHFAKAYPRYKPGVMGSTSPNSWLRFADDVNQCWHVNVSSLTPAAATLFFLGGMPNWYLDNQSPPQPILPGNAKFDPNKPIQGLLGFSADQTNPFAPSLTGRIHPFYDFDIASVGWMTWMNAGRSTGGLWYWPKSQGVTDKTTGPIVYFRAENGNYTINGYQLNQPSATASPPVSAIHNAATNVKYDYVTGAYAAVDTRLSNFQEMGPNYVSGKSPVYKWVNDQSFQLFASGLDQHYSAPRVLVNGTPTAVDCQMYPTGESYYVDPTTHATPYDDITNFSGGTLESAMKSGGK